MAARDHTPAAALSGDLNAGVKPPAGTITLNPVSDRDRGLIRQWLRDPGVQAWWGNAAAAEAEVAAALSDTSALCRLICLDGTAIGYAHAVDAGDLARRHSDVVPAGTLDCDLFIAAPAYRGLGYGQRALTLLTDEVFQTTLAIACVIVVSIRNERAVRAYEKIGFRWTKVLDDPVSGPSWIMLRARP